MLSESLSELTRDKDRCDCREVSDLSLFLCCILFFESLSYSCSKLAEHCTTRFHVTFFNLFIVLYYWCRHVLGLFQIIWACCFGKTTVNFFIQRGLRYNWSHTVCCLGRQYSILCGYRSNRRVLIFSLHWIQRSIPVYILSIECIPICCPPFSRTFSSRWIFYTLWFQ